VFCHPAPFSLRGLGAGQHPSIPSHSLFPSHHPRAVPQLTHAVREHAPRPKTRRVRKPKVIGETDGAPTAEPLAGPAAP